MELTTGAHEEPIELVKNSANDKTVAWACGKCGTVFALGSLRKPGTDTSKEDAIRHCAELICECGQPVEKSRTACPACIAKHEAEREQAVFDKAEKIPWQEYDGDMVYSERQEYYPDVETMLDSEDDPPDDPPSYAWATTPIKMSFDAADVIQSKLEAEEHHEEAYVGDDGIKELQEFFDKWCEKHPVESYFPDYTRVVMCEDLVAERLAELEDDEEDIGESNIGEGEE